MTKKMSMRGQTVDFDLMKVKQQMADSDKPNSVELREKYINIRRRRNPRRNVSDLISEQQINTDDAREKIRQSKLNAENQKTESVKVGVPDQKVTVADVVEGSDSKSKTTIASASTKIKKIVKPHKKDS